MMDQIIEFAALFIFRIALYTHKHIEYLYINSKLIKIPFGYAVFYTFPLIDISKSSYK